jgi:hypothetical protein
VKEKVVSRARRMTSICSIARLFFMGTTRTTFNQEVADDELTFRVIGCAIEVQLKTVSKLLPVHDTQLLTYMRLPGVQKDS